MPRDWQRSGDGSVEIYYRVADAALVKRVYRQARRLSRQLEKFAAQPAAAGRGQSRPAVRIYLFDTRSQYLENTGQPEWSDGSSIQRLRTVYSFVGAHKFAERILPHELAHIALREQAGFDNPAVPAWLEEGFAALFEGRSRKAQRDILRKARAAGRLIEPGRLAALSPRSIRDEAEAEIYFVQAAGIVRFLADRYGAKSLSRFLQTLGRSQDLGAALEGVYGFKDFNALYRAWQAQV